MLFYELLHVVLFLKTRCQLISVPSIHSLLSFQEYADALSELSPEQSEAHKQSVEKALQAARELEEIKKKLEEEKRLNEHQQQQENEGLLVFRSKFLPPCVLSKICTI